MVSGGDSPKSAITFNGEIYGYKTLRREHTDYPYVTESDTEYLLAAYCRHKRRTAANVPGMFAFAIWDTESQSLYCARDRFGEKPFYYAFGRSGEFVFASEVSAIVASGLVDLTICRESLKHYLLRLYVPVDRSIYQEVRALPPAHQLSWSDGRLEMETYWTMPDVLPSVSLTEASERIRELLLDAVRKQLVADVPIGVFLSGGLDSTTISLLANSIQPGIHSYSFDFPGALSERQFATAAAEAIGTQHVNMSAKSIDVADLLQTVMRSYGEPFADSSALPTYSLCELVAQNQKVALTGDGGDELFGGYHSYRRLALMEEAAGTTLVVSFLFRIRSRLMRSLNIPGHAGAEEKNVGAINARTFNSVAEAHAAQLNFFSDEQMTRIGFGGARENGTGGDLSDAIRMDVVNYMPGDILTKIDRASMAHSIELRAPFLDSTFAEYCLSLPASLKVNSKQDKIALRAAYSNEWPKEIRCRSKQGFGAPVDSWLKEDRMRQLAGDLLHNPISQINDFVDLKSLNAAPGTLSAQQKWTLLCLAVWLKVRPVA
jgi:asparagine synthase (glutamine-hydrolysing)